MLITLVCFLFLIILITCDKIWTDLQNRMLIGHRPKTQALQTADRAD